MTHLEAIMLIKEQRPQDLSSEQILALPDYIQQHPELSALCGGPEQMQRYLEMAAAARAAAASPPESPATPLLPSSTPMSWSSHCTMRVGVAIGLAALACLGLVI